MPELTPKTKSDFLKKIQDINSEEIKNWKISNLVIPIGIISITITIYVLFFTSETNTFNKCLNILLNGSIPLIAINQIANVVPYILKYDKTREKKLGLESTAGIRTNLVYYIFFILIICSILYIYQTIKQPFKNIIQIVTILLSSGVLLCCSYKVSKKIFILQDNFINSAYDTSIREAVFKTTTTQNWDKYEAEQ